jgi:hypothetical protein
MLRLTLRTLLAYLDDTLSPAEARDIGQQIAQEPSLNDLIARIKSVMRRRRLMADSPDPDVAKLDANDMAEYLDNVLPPARVVEIEKHLLESDQDLAEFASVHQILSLVLGKPADVPQSAKEQAYRVLTGRARPHTRLDPIGPKRNHAAAPGSELVAEPSASLDLSLDAAQPGNQFRTVAVVGALFAALCAMIYITVRSPDARPPRQSAAVDAPKVEGDAEPKAPAETPPAAPRGEEAPPSVEEPEAPAEATPEAPDVSQTETPAPPAETPETEMPLDPLEDFPPEESTPPPAPPAPPVPSPPTPEPEPSAADEPPGDTSPAPEIAAAPAAPADDLRPPAPRQVVPVATYVSPTGVLLRRSETRWSRIRSQDRVFEGDRLAVPAGERARIEFPNDVVVEFHGSSRVDLLFDPGADAAAALLEGKAVVAASDRPAAVVWKLPAGAWMLATDAAPTAFAVETTLLEHPTAAAPDRAPRFALDVHVLQGSLEASSGEARGSASAGERLRLLVAPHEAIPSAPAAEPAWVQEKLDSATARAASRISDHVSYGPDPESRYRSLVEVNLLAARRLAVAALASMDDFLAVASELKSKRDEVRAAAVEALRARARQGGESLQLVQSAVRRSYSENAARELNDALLGYTKAECKDVAVRRRLVSMLKSEETEIREAAISNLFEITGTTNNFSASSPDAQRKRALQRWEVWAENARIEAPEPAADDKRLLAPGEE